MTVNEPQELQLQWYCVQARVRLAEQALRNAGYLVFVPEEARYVGQGRKRVSIRVPLFGIYLFVRLDLSVHNWHRLEEIAGVQAVLTAGSGEARTPVALPDWFADWFVQQGPIEPLMLQELSRRSRKLQAHRSRPIGRRAPTLADVVQAEVGQASRLDERGRAAVFRRITGRLLPSDSKPARP